MIEALQAQYALRKRWARCRDSHLRWPIIREAYAQALPDILMTGRDPYILDWNFTPIEFLAWQDIRASGLPLYPQFPALQYFIDFADPVLQIGVELDGAAYHDRSKDTKRDEELWRHGWRIFRVPGFKSLASGAEWPLERGEKERDEWLRDIAEWGERWSEGFFWALKTRYYKRDPEPDLYDVAEWILARAHYANFELSENFNA